MDSRITQIRCKEVVDIQSGCRYGYVGDLEIDLDTGRVRALVVPGRLRLFGLLGRDRERVFPWSAIRCLGEDIVLVDAGVEKTLEKQKRK